MLRFVIFACLGVSANCFNVRSHSDYLVDSATCKIPDIDPFTEEVANISIPEPYKPCSVNKLLTYITKIDDDKATIAINKTLIPSYTNSTPIKCCYANITRRELPENPDVGIIFSACLDFEDSVTISNPNPVMIRCVDETDETIYENAYNPIIAKASIKDKIKNKNKNSDEFNVLMVVIDSLSRNNFIRSMKATRGFLLKNNFIELTGYNKIGDNTFPNAMGFLAGFTLKQAFKYCNPTELGKLDKCPMIWRKFSDSGYVTAYAEDHAEISTFNYMRRGFTRPPTDYYFKPYVEAAEFISVEDNDGAYCAGPETSGERILNIIRDFAGSFKKTPKFGIFWMNTFSHNQINLSFRFDAKLKEFFEDLKKSRVFEDSFVFVLSDHGIRVGEIRETNTGWFEERLPTHLISVPDKFKLKYPDKVKNLITNTHRLTSNFDLFMTLQDILFLSNATDHVRQSLACPRCHSLFDEVAVERTCRNAGVPDEWCTCIGGLKTVENYNSSDVLRVVNHVIEKEAFRDFKPSGLMCEEYRLDVVVKAMESDAQDANGEKTLVVIFTTVPASKFLVTVKFKGRVDEDSYYHVLRLPPVNSGWSCGVNGQ